MRDLKAQKGNCKDKGTIMIPHATTTAQGQKRHPRRHLCMFFFPPLFLESGLPFHLPFPTQRRLFSPLATTGTVKHSASKKKGGGGATFFHSFFLGGGESFTTCTLCYIQGLLYYYNDGMESNLPTFLPSSTCKSEKKTHFLPLFSFHIHLPFPPFFYCCCCRLLSFDGVKLL